MRVVRDRLGNRRGGRLIGVVSALALAAAGSMLPTTANAQAEPTIEFLNPSGYTTNTDISDKQDADGAIHLVAWVGNVPANPLVEFEISSVTTGATTIDATRASTDTWEAFLQASSLPDRQYTLTARLYKDFAPPSTGEQVDEVTRTVTLNRADIPPPPTANTVEITYPENGGPFGIFNPKGKRQNGLIDVRTSATTDQVRALYTRSEPGSVPVWTACGSAQVLENLTSRVRCTLEDGVTGAQVRAIAVVANESPWPAEANPVADATGDAHRVAPYTQVATSVDIDPEAATAEPSKCFTLTATPLDQDNRPISGANLDIHALGPDDQIRFGFIERVTTEWQAPDKGHVASHRPAIDCADGTNEGLQGDHNIPGSNDPQHIESVAGTNAFGQFVFALRSGAIGTTQITAWVDGDDDDTQQITEGSGGARVGWGETPQPPSQEIFLEPSTSSAQTGSCQRVVAVGRVGGSPISGQNVDVHASGPDSTVAFCTPEGASASRIPDGGTHASGSDDETTRHIEGEFDSAGRFVFGVTSATEGTTALSAWIDVSDDDINSSGEPTRNGTVGWGASGERTISLQSNRSAVERGRSVRLFGAINGSSACEADQRVKLQAKKGRNPFRTIKTTTTDSGGAYSFTVTVRKTKTYRSVAPLAGVCEKARSSNVKVRAT